MPISQKTLTGMLTIGLATAMWGVAGSLIAGIHVNAFAAAAALELIAGVCLILFGKVTGASVMATVRQLRWWLLLLGAVEGANTALYFAALHMAPLSLVMSMHLTSPVILSAIAISRGTRQGGRREMGAMLSICTAVVLLTASQTGSSNSGKLLVGMLLALCSAGCLALLITIVAKLTRNNSPLMGAGVQKIASGVMLSPALILFNGDRHETAALALIGIVLVAPAPWLYWRVLRNLSPIQTGTIQLLEPFFGSAAAVLLYGTRPALIEGIAATFILFAAWLETGAPLVVGTRARRPAVASSALSSK